MHQLQCYIGTVCPELMLNHVAVMQIINILTLGSPSGVGGFFPSGLVGNITSPVGYNLTASGTESWGNATEVNEVYAPSTCILCSH